MKKIYISVALISVLSIAAFLWWAITDMEAQLDRPLAIESAEIFTVDAGTSLKKLSNQLVARGWLSNPCYLIIEGRGRGIAARIKAGEYEFKAGISPRGVLDLIVSGKVVQYPMTIPEGWTFQQILKAVQNNDVLVQTIGSSGADGIMEKLGRPDEVAEGRFSPDTYHFPRGTTDMDFLRRAYNTMSQILGEEWQLRDVGLPYTSPYEALIMASIIEKETAIPEERHKIAGVFIRRLQRGMMLQADPTIIYAIGQDFDGDVRERDLILDSPYNTYLNKGLPPTPIAAPGRAAIRAALHPDDSTALYFVAMGDGRHHFSDTLMEHNMAVAKYQLKK